MADKNPKARLIGSNGSRAGSEGTHKSGKYTKKGQRLNLRTASNRGIERVQALLNAGSEIPRNSVLMQSQRASSRYRSNLLNPNEKTAKELKELKRNNANISAKDFAVNQGVSMDFLNRFHQDFLQEEEFKSIHLFIYKKTGETVSWDNKDKASMKDGKAITVIHTGRVKNTRKLIKISDLRQKKREDWTIGDITNYCIYPILAKAQQEEENETEIPKPEALHAPTTKPQTFLDIIGVDHLGPPCKGFYVVADASNNFSDLINALQEYCKDEYLGPMDTYIYLDMFSLDHEKIKRADSLKYPAMSKAYKEFLRNGVQDVIVGFDERLVFVENWVKPKILKRLWCIWQLYCMKETTYKLLSNDYELINEHIWNKEDDNLFSMIELLDPSALQVNTQKMTNLDLIFRDEFLQYPTGLARIKTILREGLTRWFTLEIEDNLRLLDANDNTQYDKITEDMYTRVSADMLKAGKFNYWRKRYVISKTYLDDALNFYTYFELETYLDSVSDLNRTAIELEKPPHFTKKFCNNVLRGLITVRLFLSRVLAYQSRYRDALAVVRAAEKAANHLTSAKEEKKDFLMECQLAFGDVYKINNETIKAIDAFRHAELTWRVEEDKRERVIKLSYELGSLLRTRGKTKEAMEFLNRALVQHTEQLTENEQQDDIFKADIIMEIARTSFMARDYDNARKSFTAAQKIVGRRIGSVNVRAAKLEYFVGNCMAKKKLFDTALQSYDHAITVMKQCLGENCNEVAAIFRAKGGSYRSKAVDAEKQGDKVKQGEYQELELQCLKNGLETVKRIKNPESYKKKYLDIASYSINLADTLKALNRANEAQSYYDDAVTIRIRELGTTSPLTVRARGLKFKNTMDMT